MASTYRRFKKNFLARKTEIKAEFRSKMGLIVDQPRVGGCGTSNDGNTARKFFKHPDISANITGIDKDVII